MTRTLKIGGQVVAIACVVALLVLLARRAERRAEGRVQDVVAKLEGRMDEGSRELGRALERAEAESRRSRFLGGIAESIDLDEVLARTLEAARALPGADAALVRIDAHEGKPVVATFGLSTEEAERQAIAGPHET